MKDSKNQIIRSMKSYETGGSTDDSCMEEYTAADGKRRRRRKKGGCGKVTKYGRRSVPEGVKKVLGAVATGTAAVLANKKFGLVDKAKEAMGMKKGGTVKRKMQMGGITASMDPTCGPGRPCHKSNKKANNSRLKDAGVSRSNRRRMS